MSNNHPYKIIPDRITKLAENQIFVFGSNTQGKHGAGIALFARQYCNAEYGNPQGRQGQSWAMATPWFSDSFALFSSRRCALAELSL